MDVSHGIITIVGKDAVTCTVIEGVAPQRLDREGAGTQRDVGRRALSGTDPGALVTILTPFAIGPAGAGENVGSGFGELMASDNPDAIGQASRARVDEVSTATGFRASNVGHIGIGNITVDRSRRTVPRAVLRPEPARVIASRSVIHILNGCIGSSGRVAEMCCRVDRLTGEIGLTWF